MCRLFGFKSVIKSQVHDSLLSADNALIEQSCRHPDGWGLAYYAAGAPHLIRSEKTAIDDSLFSKISGVVSSDTVVAHIRKATEGSISILNTHPFQYGNWVFCHNGNIKNLDKHIDKIKDRIAPGLRRFILGKTDSELIFYYILTFISEKAPLTRTDFPIKLLAKAVRKAVDSLIEIIGPYSEISDAGPQETYITFLLTNGAAMIAHNGGKRLFYSTYKQSCPDAETCTSYVPECLAASKSGYVNHLKFCSEPLKGNSVWIESELGDLIGVDWHMKLRLFPKGEKIEY